MNRNLLARLWLMVIMIGLAAASSAPAENAAGQTALRQNQPSPETVASWPFVTGIPLPRGAVTNTANLCLLDSQGKTIPAHFEGLAHWSPARDSIKWLRIAFNAPTVKGQTPEYTLQYGTKAVAVPIAAPINLSEDPEQIVVDIGVMQLTLSKKSGGLPLRVIRSSSGKKAYESTPLDGPYVIDHTGVVFRAALDDKPFITVEESGPLRAVVRVEAWHVKEGTATSPAGDRLNKSILRYYVYAGQPWIALDWTFVITADTDQVRFKDIGLRMTGAGPARIGLEDAAAGSVELSEGFLLQKKADQYIVRRKHVDGFEQIAAGGKAPGWMSDGNIAVTMRDFWQMFPKELEAADRAMIVHAWPGHGENNADWFLEPAAPPAEDVDTQKLVGASGVKLTPAYFCLHQKWHQGPLLDFHFPSWWHQANMAGTAEKGSWLSTALGGDRTWEMWSLGYVPPQEREKLKYIATGASRTQQLLLDFSGDSGEQLAARRAMFLASPHVWLKDTQMLAESQALGPMDVKAAQSWDEASLKSWAVIGKAGYYGMWIWGNMPEYFSPDSLPALYRQVNSGTHYGYCNTHWLLYLTTGRAEHLRFARANAHHWRDVSVVQYSTPELAEGRNGAYKILGAANMVGYYPWRSGTEFTFYSSVFPLLMDYYFTGDRRSLETADLHAHAMFPTLRSNSHSREYAGTLKTAIDWYTHSWDPQYAQAIDGGIHWLVNNDPTMELSKGGLFNWTNWMGQYLDQTRYPDVPLKHRDEIIEFVKRWDEEWIDKTDSSPSNLLTAAWLATGDAKYLRPFARAMLWAEKPRDQWLTPQSPGLGSNGGGPVYFDRVLYSYAAWRGAMQKGVMPSREAELPQPAPPPSYVSPSHHDAGRGISTYAILKEPGKPWRMQFKPYVIPYKLLITAPDGSKAVEQTIPNDDKWHEYGLPADAAPGVYQLDLSAKWGWSCFIKPADKHMLKVDAPTPLRGDTEWYFQVPAGVKQFKVAIRNGTMTVLDPQLHKAAGPTENGMQTVEVPAGMDGKLWRVRVVSGAISLEGIPPYIAAHQDFWFAMP